MSYAGVVAAKREPSTLSLVRLKSRECFNTAPAATSPTCRSCRPKRATSPSRVAVSMSWLDAWAYAELERANGIRFPPTIAALRRVDAIGSSSVERTGRYSRYAVLTVTINRTAETFVAAQDRACPRRSRLGRRQAG